MHHIRFRLGLRSRPHWATGGAYSAPQTPTWILGVLLLRDARGGEEAKKGKEGKVTKKGREGKGGRSLPLPLPNSLRHWVRRALRSVRDSG